MPALDPETHQRWRDLVVVDRESATVGTIETFYLDQASGLPTWALVHTGWLGDRRSFVPLAAAVEVDGEIRLPYTKAQIREAPAVASDGELGADDELALVGHYGLHDLRGAVPERPRETEVAEATGPSAVAAARREPHPAASGAPEREGSPAAGTVAPVVHTPHLHTPHLHTSGPDTSGPDTSGPDTSGPHTPGPDTSRTGSAADPGDAGLPGDPGDAGLVVTRSEEELVVGRRTRVRRLRLRKYVVTEYVTRTIPVRRERVRLEEVAADTVVDGGADDWDDPAPDGATQLEVVLYREEPEIRLRPVPVERARLVKRRVSEQRTITEELRKERVEVDEPPARP